MAAWWACDDRSGDFDRVTPPTIDRVMDETAKANGYEFYFEYEKFRPIGGPGGQQFEVFVTRYYDRTDGDGSKRLHDDVITGPHKARGKTLKEAWEKSAALAMAWAEEQPRNRK